MTMNYHLRDIFYDYRDYTNEYNITIVLIIKSLKENCVSNF